MGTSALSKLPGLVQSIATNVGVESTARAAHEHVVVLSHRAQHRLRGRRGEEQEVGGYPARGKDRRVLVGQVRQIAGVGQRFVRTHRKPDCLREHAAWAEEARPSRNE